MLHAVIMAGGSGTRFWPVSRNLRPKQLLNLVGTRTMLQATVDRLQGLIPPERTLVVTNQLQAEAIAAQLPELSPAAILGEPCKRDTAPCIGLAALCVLRHDPAATMVVMPSDHVIEPAADFRQALQRAADLVLQQPTRLVTFGIRPTYPAESFGYIRRGSPVPAAAQPPVYAVSRFREKPDKPIAEEYLASGQYYWNSGIFVWQARTIVDELQQRQSRMMDHLRTIANALETPTFDEVFSREFAAVKGVSIDYAVMEHAQDVVVVEAPFTWDDVGSWQALARLRGADADGNTIVARRHLEVDTRDSIIRSDEDHLIVTLGMKDCLVVHTPDATLVANKHDEEAIRQLARLLEERGWQEYL